MRKLLLIAALLVGLTGMAQQLKRVFLFNGFSDGVVLYKNGAKVGAKLNYDANNFAMLYMQGNVMMELVNPQTVDTVYVGGKKLVYHDKRFCEVVDLGADRKVLIGWLIKSVYEGRTGAFGLPTQAQVIKLRAVDLIGPEYRHNMNAGMEAAQYDARNAELEVWQQKNANSYYFVKDGVEVTLRKMNDIYKYFPGKKEQIKAYAKENNLDMMHTQRALRLIDYLMKL